jgi:hypothetical protein
MKHRSVIGFVIVAAALFSLPQLSHDLQALKGAAAAHLHRELLHAFLSLPTGEPTSPVAVASPSDNLLASCPKEKSGAATAKSGRAASNGRAEGKSFEQSAMLGDPAHDPINQVASVEFKEAADDVVASLPEVKVETAEVAMIIPPDSGIDPRALSNRRTSKDGARVEADKLRVEAAGLRVAYAAAARFDAQGAEWQKATEEAVRKLNATLPGTYEFRVVRDGAKARVLKFKCGDCPARAPRAPQPPRQLPAVAPAPVTFTSAEWAGE